ncbi:MAG: hypothetical protein M1445_00085 [Bacteroidetes bacterium]|nr:hypothetical protein [Bacteroidota bacterium]
MQLLSQRQMLNKTVTVALLLLFSAGLLTAKEKAFSLKKMTTVTSDFQLVR